MNPQAQELNDTISSVNPVVYDVLSTKGKEIFFPAKGILAQTAAAKGKAYNATIGIAYEEDGSPLRLGCVDSHVDVNAMDAYPYAPSFGKKELREKWASFQKEKNGLVDEVSLPVVTSALTHGLSMCGYLFMDKGDKVITPNLFWGNYNLIFRHGYGVEFDEFETFVGGRFNVSGLREKLMGAGEKKIVLLNFPNNPTGYTLTVSEAELVVSAITEAADAGKKIVVIIDDAYFGLVYEEGVLGVSLFKELSSLSSNVLAVKVDGATKEDYVWGFRVGFLTFGIKGGTSELYAALESKTAGAVRGNVSNVCHVSQSVLVDAYSSSSYNSEKKEKYDLLKKRYDTVKEILSEHSEYGDEFEALPYNSGYFMCVRLKNADPEEVRQLLLEKYDTGVIATKGLIRLAYSSVPTDKLESVFKNLFDACVESSS